MAISGIVIHLAPDDRSYQAALEQLAQEPCLSLGETVGSRVAAVLDTVDAEQDLEVFERIRSMTAVSHVDVVMVYFGDALETFDPFEPFTPQGIENIGAGI